MARASSRGIIKDAGATVAARGTRILAIAGITAAHVAQATA
jgi:hypothetical protein